MATVYNEGINDHIPWSDTYIICPMCKKDAYYVDSFEFSFMPHNFVCVYCGSQLVKKEDLVW